MLLTLLAVFTTFLVLSMDDQDSDPQAYAQGVLSLFWIFFFVVGYLLWLVL
jgi:hypothetical protein